MKFVKWASAENTYRTKEISKWLDIYPELANTQYILTEKLHGSNFQIAIDTFGNVNVGSRKNWLDINGSFQGAKIAEILNDFSKVIETFSQYATEYNTEVRLFGELFGNEIQKGVDYGKEKKLLLFGIMLDGRLMEQQYLIDAIPTNKRVPIIAICNSLEEAINYDTKFNSTIIDADNNICEGVVISPLLQVYEHNGSVFLLKKKNDEFSEKVHAPKDTAIDTEAYALNAEFKSYITGNRIESVFSKYGQIQSTSEIGKYIKLVLDDAMEEFMKDFGDEFSTMNKTQQKTVTNIGSMLANLLKNYL